jgi:hypothetical protein
VATYATNRRNEGNLVREASALQGLVVHMSILSRDCTVRMNEQILGVELLLRLAASIVALYEIRKLEKKFMLPRNVG